MATPDQLKAAILQADAAGDTESARRFAEMYKEASAQPQGHSLFGALAQGVSSIPSHLVQAWHGATVDLPDAAVGLATNPDKRKALAAAIQQQASHAGDVIGGYAQQVRDLSPPQFQGSAPRMATAPAQAMEANVVREQGINPAPQRLARALGGDVGQPNSNAYNTFKTDIAEHPLQVAASLAPAAPALGKIAEVTGAGEKLAAGLSKITPPPIPEAPSVEALRGQAGTLYEAAKQQGVVVKAPVFKTFATDLAAKAEDAGIDPTLTAKATAALKRITDTQGDVDLGQLDRLRRIASMATASPVKDDRRIGFILKDGLDQFVGKLSPGDVVSGDPAAASKMLTDARGLWARGAKGQALEDLIAKAKANSTLGTYDTQLRNQFRKFAANPKAMAGFSEEEQDAIRKVASGGAVSDALYAVGGLAPTNAHTALWEAMAGGGMAYGAHSPEMAAAMPAIGIPAKVASTVIASRRAKLASAMARAGANP